MENLREERLEKRLKQQARFREEISLVYGEENQMKSSASHLSLELKLGIVPSDRESSPDYGVGAGSNVFWIVGFRLSFLFGSGVLMFILLFACICLYACRMKALFHLHLLFLNFEFRMFGEIEQDVVLRICFSSNFRVK